MQYIHLSSTEGRVFKLLPSMSRTALFDGHYQSICLSSSNCINSSGMPMFVLSARMYLCRGDHLLRCSCLRCLFEMFVTLKNAEQSGSGHEKGASVSAFSSHSYARADSFHKTSHFGMLPPHELSPLPDSTRLFRTSGTHQKSPSS